jgi:cytochrome c-type biogenesis protein CcsB
MKYFSLDQILSNPRLGDIFQELQNKRDKKIKLDPFGQAAQRLENQLFTFRELVSGRLLKVLPETSDKWKSLLDLNEDESAQFVELTKKFIELLDPSSSVEAQQGFETQLSQFLKLIPEGIVNQTKIKLEVHYSDFHPFRWAWVFYILSFLTAILVWIFKKERLIFGMWAFCVAGLVMHIYGFAIRSYLSERAPVTNMYETIVWVALGAVIFAMIIEYTYRWKLILAAGTAVGSFCLILSDFAPAVLDPTIQPLEPVLRSNFWLTIHVLVITISYAAFFLAFALGDIGLFFSIKDEPRYRDRIKATVLASYRAIQIGVAFLAPGIILGGIWADYSWGRFWGWDPKETWALIALLGYLAVLHARLSGWLKEFGMLVTSILAFSLVIMAWYGVNYVLGAGLHTYGFGAGGIEYVSSFVGLHILYVIFAVVVRIQKRQTTA